MESSTTVIRCALVAVVFMFGAVRGQAEDIGGTISATRVITEDSRLVSDVTCTMVGAACIQFGASNITLRLNGFSLTGMSDPVRGCAGVSTAGETGINAGVQSDVAILGPGLVQRFRSHGIFVGGARVKVMNVTVSGVCMSGIFLAIASADNHVEGNVLVRNGHATLPCGGICINGSSRNRVLRNLMSANGYSDQTGTTVVNFGIGLIAPGSNDNLIEGNNVAGNANGIFLAPPTIGNMIRSNVATGNPPIQVSNSIPDTSGVDIRNLSPTGANTFVDNLCVTSMNASCPGFTQSTTPLPSVVGITLSTTIARPGGSYNATFSGSALTDRTFFDVRFRSPGAAADEFAWNWQQGVTARHSIAGNTALGSWLITGVRAHQDENDHSGPFQPVSATLVIVSF